MGFPWCFSNAVAIGFPYHRLSITIITNTTTPSTITPPTIITIITMIHAHPHCIRDKDMDRPISLIAYLGPLTVIFGRKKSMALGENV